MSQPTHAKIHFNEQGTPVASDFDDVYFSNDGGLEETDYVFLQKNNLPSRFDSHPHAAFHIIETGFGTGANFLLTWLKFRQFKTENPNATCQRLYFSSFEKFPLSYDDLARALQTHTHLKALCDELLAAYPLCVSGCHRLVFDNASVFLDLWFGDVNDLLPKLNTKADAIYLDGFAPSKNPDMWQDSLFNGLAKLSHQETSIATFTSAGIVKRGLQQAGFNIKKVKGFGKKREMLTASMQDNPNADIVEKHSQPKSVALVGGGIASICSALALCEKGVQVHLICEDDGVAKQASKNRQGAIYPNLHSTVNDDSLVYVHSFLYARRFYQAWQKRGLTFAMDWCGLLHLATNKGLELRQDKVLSRQLWPNMLVKGVNATEASELSGLLLNHSGIFFPLAGWLSPQQFCEAALNYLKTLAHFSITFNCTISALSKNTNKWLLHSEANVYEATNVILACGSKLIDFSQVKPLPLNKIRGQVSYVSSTNMAALKTIVCHKGYITPKFEGLHSLGATFDRTATEAFISEADDNENIALVKEQLHEPTWLEDVKVQSASAGFRATLPGHLPVVGNIFGEDNLYVIGGLGARGIMLSPLLAEFLACEITQEPSPLTPNLKAAVSFNRFI